MTRVGVKPGSATVNSVAPPLICCRTASYSAARSPSLISSSDEPSTNFAAGEYTRTMKPSLDTATILAASGLGRVAPRG